MKYIYPHFFAHFYSFNELEWADTLGFDQLFSNGFQASSCFGTSSRITCDVGNVLFVAILNEALKGIACESSQLDQVSRMFGSHEP